MTVKELIEELKKFDEDLEVDIGEFSMFSPTKVHEVVIGKNYKAVWIE